MKQELHSKKGHGTIRTIKDRSTQTITGFQALLPEALSKAPKKAGNRYREPIGPVHATRPAARAYLDKALALRAEERPQLKHGLRLIDYLEAEIAERHASARGLGMNEVQANGQTAAWRSHTKVWLSSEGFARMPPTSITRGDIQTWVNRLRVARRRGGRPLAANSIHNMVEMVRAAFHRFNEEPERVNAPAVDPTQGLRLPDRAEPKIPHLELDEQLALLSTPKILLRDRVMIGCGMGSGLRVGELLALERRHVKLNDPRPHLMVYFGGKDRAPTKGRKERRVELFEPGLGFFRLWLAKFAGEGPLVFVGPLGGHMGAWAERFQTFGTLAGLDRLTSHYMRHTYAVSMLSGTWGYEPRSLEFVQAQLGHTEIQTTQRYYGTHTVGTWAQEVAIMTNGQAEETARKRVTALDLLGASNGGKFAKSPVKLALLLGDGQLTKQRKTPGKAKKNAPKGASAHHSKKGVA